MNANGMIIETERLILRKFVLDDAGFILQLLNDPAWLRFIGDRGVRTPDDARRYLIKGPLEMYKRHGFGLYLAELKKDRIPLGMCGLIKREALEDVDIGFAFLPQFRGLGYAYESALGVMGYGRDVVGLKRLAAIAAPNNEASTRLLLKLGFKFEKMILYQGENLKLFVCDC
jgi:RimJ/RimL family protein N-acetyltransferase